MLHFVLTLISVFMLGMTTAVVFLPWAIKFVKNKTMTTLKRAEYLLEQTKIFDAKKVRQSEVFKNRLKIILESIEDVSKSGNNELVITHMKNCHTDNEIREALCERHFETVKDCDGPNSLRIMW